MAHIPRISAAQVHRTNLLAAGAGTVGDDTHTISLHVPLAYYLSVGQVCFFGFCMFYDHWLMVAVKPSTIDASVAVSKGRAVLFSYTVFISSNNPNIYFRRIDGQGNSGYSSSIRISGIYICSYVCLSAYIHFRYRHRQCTQSYPCSIESQCRG